MLASITREEEFGTIIYSPKEDRFVLKPKKKYFLDEKLSAPLTLHWITTMRCNARCPYCYELPYLLKPSDKEDCLSEDEIKKFIDDFADIGGFRLYLTGGEPTLSPSLIYIVEKAYEKGVKTVINSNGIRIPDDIYGAIRDYEARLSLSLDSHIREVHDKIRKQKSYDSIVDVIRRGRKDCVDIRVISVSQQNDFSYWRDFGTFLSYLGVKYWFIQEEVNNGSERPADGELEKRLRGEFPLMYVRVLPAIFDSFMYVLPNGDVGINLWAPNRRIYGSVITRQIQDIWDLHKYNRVRDHLGILNIEE